jgi:hypothetical protein
VNSAETIYPYLVPETYLEVAGDHREGIAVPSATASTRTSYLRSTALSKASWSPTWQPSA